MRSPADTERFGERIGGLLKGGEVLALYGDLGAGKTTLIGGIAAGLGVPRRAVTSPTFALIHEYKGRLTLVHADLYRLRAEAELAHVGLSEYVNGRAVVAVEWAEKAEGYLPDDRLEIRLAHSDDRGRHVLLEARGRDARRLLRDLKRSIRSRRRMRGGQGQEPAP